MFTHRNFSRHLYRLKPLASDQRARPVPYLYIVEYDRCPSPVGFSSDRIDFRIFYLYKRKSPEANASGLARLRREYSPDICGADYEARTRYLHLGKVALYQMS